MRELECSSRRELTAQPGSVCQWVGGLLVDGLARDLTNFCVVSLSSTAPVKTLRGFPTHGLAKGKARHLPFTATPGIARHSHTWLIEWLSHNPKRDDELRGYLRSQQERRVPCSLISARSRVQLTTRAYSPVWFGLSVGRGVAGGLGGVVGSFSVWSQLARWHLDRPCAASPFAA